MQQFEIAEELEFEIINEGDLETRIYEASIYQIGYELVGFFKKILRNYKTIYIFVEQKEIDYLKTLNYEDRVKILDEYMSFSFPLLVFSSYSDIPERFLEC